MVAVAFISARGVRYENKLNRITTQHKIGEIFLIFFRKKKIDFLMKILGRFFLIFRFFWVFISPRAARIAAYRVDTNICRREPRKEHDIASIGASGGLESSVSRGYEHLAWIAAYRADTNILRG